MYGLEVPSVIVLVIIVTFLFGLKRFLKRDEAENRNFYILVARFSVGYSCVLGHLYYLITIVFPASAEHFFSSVASFILSYPLFIFIIAITFLFLEIIELVLVRLKSESKV